MSMLQVPKEELFEISRKNLNKVNFKVNRLASQ